jgi:hypothetical protein
MSVSRHSIAAGRSDLETSALAEELLNIIHDIIDGKLLGTVSNGRVLATAIEGQMGPPQGGTGNAMGEAMPLDGSVTDVKVAAGADIQPSKLNQTLLKTSVYNLLKLIVLAGGGTTITPNDLLQTLTIASSSSTSHWEPVTNGDPDAPEIIFVDGDVLMIEVFS